MVNLRVTRVNPGRGLLCFVEIVLLIGCVYLAILIDIVNRYLSVDFTNLLKGPSLYKLIKSGWVLV